MEEELRKAQRQVHRKLLKRLGVVHLPPNKTEKTKKQYKRKKFTKKEIDNGKSDES